jgi:hypothetical protein
LRGGWKGEFFEVPSGLFDLGRPMRLIVGIEARALEFDLVIEDDIVIELIGWQQHEPGGVEAAAVSLSRETRARCP